MKDTENRFIDIESKLAFQEDTIQELNEIVYQQQRQIERLNTSMKQLQDRIKAETTVAPTNVDPADDVPPHY